MSMKNMFRPTRALLQRSVLLPARPASNSVVSAMRMMPSLLREFEGFLKPGFPLSNFGNQDMQPVFPRDFGHVDVIETKVNHDFFFQILAWLTIRALSFLSFSHSAYQASQA